MRITNTTTQHKTQAHPSFGWIKLCSGNIVKQYKSGNSQLIPVDICMIREEDVKLMNHVDRLWKGALYARRMLESFLDGRNIPKRLEDVTTGVYYLMLKPKSNKFLPKDLPLCLAEISRCDDSVYVEFIESARSVKYPTSNGIKGCGEMLMYGIAKYAKSIKKPTIEFISASDDFYKKIFRMRIQKGSTFVKVNSRKINQFIRNVQAKYKLKNEPETLSPEVLEKMADNTYDYDLKELPIKDI